MVHSPSTSGGKIMVLEIGNHSFIFVSDKVAFNRPPRLPDSKGSIVHFCSGILEKDGKRYTKDRKIRYWWMKILDNFRTLTCDNCGYTFSKEEIFALRLLDFRS
jgi:hypothetical protein